MLSMANLSDENSRFFFNQVKLGPLKPWITEQYFFYQKASSRCNTPLTTQKKTSRCNFYKLEKSGKEGKEPYSGLKGRSQVIQSIINVKIQWRNGL